MAETFFHKVSAIVLIKVFASHLRSKKTWERYIVEKLCRLCSMEKRHIPLYPKK